MTGQIDPELAAHLFGDDAASEALAPIARGAVDPQSDLANAERLARTHGRDLRYVPKWGKWLCWDGSRWELDSTCRVPSMCADVARLLMGEAVANLERSGGDKAAESFYRFARQSQDAKRLDGMAKVAAGLDGMAVGHAELDANPRLLNVANGIVDLRTGALRPHNRAALMTKLAPVAYAPHATCPTWDAFLLRAMGGDAELVGYLRRLVGYSLSGDTGEHVLAFLFGGGANGKSTFLSTLHTLFGDYGARAPRGLLFKHQGSQHETNLTMLFGSRFVTCAEIDEGASFDEALLKDLTGGDAISARRMREDFWTFNPTHKLWLAGNHRPLVRGADEGVWRRIRLIPWTVTIPREERDTGLPAKLLAELPGVLAWAVRGCLEWHAHGLGDPPAVQEATSAYREESDTFGQFVRERCRLDPAGRVSRKEFRSEYEAWSKEIGALPLGAKTLAERLRAFGVRKGKVRHGMQTLDAWAGVRLMTSAEGDVVTW
ncbi:MAG TPA: phage/plasmid primase, P4 family [Polyangiaceae bacterium]|nr:phage/plasmid primase, P4 family [Polyangiaceae bacterium]